MNFQISEFKYGVPTQTQCLFWHGQDTKKFQCIMNLTRIDNMWAETGSETPNSRDSS